MRVSSGSPRPLGATWDGGGVNFAIYSEHATRVTLCLFDDADAAAESQSVPIETHTEFVWHVYLHDARPGQLYGYRVDGPWDPAAGHRFDATKIVLDPYAKAIGRAPRWRRAPEAPGTDEGAPIETAVTPDPPLAAVLDPAFAWADDRRPATPWHETVIDEVHVGGFSRLNDAVPAALRGTYLGLASEPAIHYLRLLGVTAVELMPIDQHADEARLAALGLVNYWGYNTLSYFAPDVRFASAPGEAVREFKTMVRALHAAGLEVILDVVYNHTAEGDDVGPTLSLRGIDNVNYYRLTPGQPSRYEDFTGCGNTLDARSPVVRRLILDSLRYWVDEMHVDGFRFDLAPALARGAGEVDERFSLFTAIHEDPVLSQVKLIVEPWDAAAGGYQVGRFPVGWSEWNGRYRDAVRRFWRGDPWMLPEFATRIAGSSDLYDHGGRGPDASINFITSHDGFTLADLVAYEHKHNDANGEGNRDGESNNLSWNCGVEGPSDDPAIHALRRRQRRNFMLTLLLSQGVPMMSGGDEVGRTQRGNNNAYCHDSALSWTPWSAGDWDPGFCAFVQRVIALRAAEPVLRQRAFLAGRRGDEVDVLWYSPAGREMTHDDWNNPELRTIGALLDGGAIGDRDGRSRRGVGRTLLLLFNASPDDVEVALPAWRDGEVWRPILDTGDSNGCGPVKAWTLTARSAAVFAWEGLRESTPGVDSGC